MNGDISTSAAGTDAVAAGGGADKAAGGIIMGLMGGAAKELPPKDPKAWFNR